MRQYKVAVLREVAERYDLDGINLDFGRHPPFLPTGQQWEHREALTDFVRQVRLMLQGVAERRGRPFLLSVRVADTVPGCHFDGMDMETWVRQNLVDMIVIGTRSIQVDLAGFKRITAGSHVKLYPCIDQHHSPDGYHAVPSPEFLRGVAANWWHQGADGIATFNFWNELPESGKVIGTSGPLIDGQSVHALAYKEIGDPQTTGITRQVVRGLAALWRRVLRPSGKPLGRLHQSESSGSAAADARRRSGVGRGLLWRTMSRPRLIGSSDSNSACNSPPTPTRNRSP